MVIKGYGKQVNLYYDGAVRQLTPSNTNPDVCYAVASGATKTLTIWGTKVGTSKFSVYDGQGNSFDLDVTVIDSTISPINPTLTIGETLELTSTNVFPENETYEFSWYTGDSNVVTVQEGKEDTHAVITAVGAGTANVGILIDDAGYQSTTVTVVSDTSSFTLDKESVEVIRGHFAEVKLAYIGERNITIEIEDTDEDYPANVAYFFADSRTLWVTGTGDGWAIMHLSDGLGNTQDLSVRVFKADMYINADSMEVGDEGNAYIDASDEALWNRTPHWYSTNEDVVTITPYDNNPFSGKLDAIGPGYATIQFYMDDVVGNASFTVFVTEFDGVYEADVIDSFDTEEEHVRAALILGSSEGLTEVEMELYDKVVEIAEELEGDSEYESVKNIHDYLVRNIVYTPQEQITGGYSDQAVRTALFYNRCVCVGYAKSFYMLCTALGIDARLVTGTADGSNGYSSSHAWNKVKIGNNWYSIDCTWDDPLPDGGDEVQYYYFLVTDADMDIDHNWDDESLPDAVSNDLAIVYGLYSDTVKFTSSDDAYAYIVAELEDYVNTHSPSQEGFDFSLTLLCTEEDLNRQIDGICNDYNSQYGCRYGWGYKSAGFYGFEFSFCIYNGSANNG